MLFSNMFGLVVAAILLSTVTDIHGRYLLYRPRPGVSGTVSHRKIVATWDEAKQRCEREGAVLASPIDEGLLEYMKSSIGVNNHTTPYFIGMKAVGNPELIFVSVEGVLLGHLPDGAIDMIEELEPKVGDCLSMDRNSIRVMACRARLPYLCYIPNEKIMSSKEVTTEVTTQATTEASTEWTTQTTAEASTEWTTQATTEASTEWTTQATTEASTEWTTQATTEASTEWTTQATTEASTEWTTQATTEASTEWTTQATTEASTEWTTQATTEASTEWTTQATTEASTEWTTQATTELMSSERTTTAAHINLRGYRFYSTGSYYKLHLEKRGWDEAQSTCTSEGGYLAVINNEKEATVIKKLAFSATRSPWVAIGLRDYSEDGTWTSVHDEPIDELYNTWAPTRSKNRFCGSLKKTGKLDDQYCGAKYPFVCEIRLKHKMH